ncbi:hypothetical protein L9F63_004857, partial [Diploptera punctata]
LETALLSPIPYIRENQSHLNSKMPLSLRKPQPLTRRLALKRVPLTLLQASLLFAENYQGFPSFFAGNKPSSPTHPPLFFPTSTCYRSHRRLCLLGVEFPQGQGPSSPSTSADPTPPVHASCFIRIQKCIHLAHTGDRSAERCSARTISFKPTDLASSRGPLTSIHAHAATSQTPYDVIDSSFFGGLFTVIYLFKNRKTRNKIKVKNIISDKAMKARSSELRILFFIWIVRVDRAERRDLKGLLRYPNRLPGLGSFRTVTPSFVSINDDSLRACHNLCRP